MLKTALYGTAATVAAAVMGALLGSFGSLLDTETRVAVALLMTVAGALIGVADLTYINLKLPQRDCETHQSWLRKGPYYWAIRNGSALGVGATSRIGFWLWFAIPLASFLFGNAALGIAVYGLYGLVRSWSVLFHFVSLPVWTRIPRDETGVFLFLLNGQARTATSLLLIGVCACAFVILAF